MADRQTALTEDAPMILDATCSFGKVWPKTATVRIDIRPEVRPDLVMDARQLRFPSSFFDAIYCDPPTIFGEGKGYRFTHDMVDRYGHWNSRKEWLDFANRSTREFHRCLKPTGLLFYKITETRDRRLKIADILAVGLFEIIEDKTTVSKSNHTKSTVHWLTMKPSTSPA